MANHASPSRAHLDRLPTTVEHASKMNVGKEGVPPRIDISFANPSMPSNFNLAIVGDGADASPSSPVQDSELIEIESSQDSVRQHESGLPSTSAAVDCERSRSRGQLRDLCRAGLRAATDQSESGALVPMGEPDADADGASSSTFHSLAASLRSVTAAMEGHQQMAELQAAQLKEAKDRETMHIAQLMEKDKTIAKQQLDLLRASETAGELETRLHQAEKTPRTAVNQMWERRIEAAKEELREEMRNILSPILRDTDHRLSLEASATISQISLDDKCQFQDLWKCLVVLYHIIFQIEGEHMDFKVEPTPWRVVQVLINKGIRLSAEGKRKIEKFDQAVQHIISKKSYSESYSESDWENMMRIYKRLWPFKGPAPAALDWWSLSTEELLQAVPWTSLYFLII